MKNLKIVVLIVVLINSFILAQSISFSNPTNGNTYTSTGNSSKVGVYLSYGYSYTPSPVVVISNYVKLILGGSQTYSTQGSSYIPNYFEVDPGSHTWKLEYWEMRLGESGYYIRAEQEITFTTKFTIYAANNFPGGVINLEGNQVSVNGTANKVNKFPNESVSVSSIEQSNNNYWMIWNTSGTNNSNWKNGSANIYGATSSSLSYTVGSGDNGVTLSSDMKKLCSITLSNPDHHIYLNGNTYNSSVTANVVEQNTISPSAEGYFVVNGIEHAFQNLWKSSSSGQNFATVTASQHDTYTAVYRIQAVNPAISFGTTLNMPIVINWTDNPNSNVTQYRIHRREYNNGWSADQIIANVNSGVQTYTDNEYILKPWRQNTWLEYGLTAYYTVEGSWSTGGANTQVYGLQTLMQSDESTLINTEKEVPTNYSISNHPNPFNPTTTINYQLPKDGMVTIKVYDIIGKEVATLVNEQKSAGYYKVQFNARHLERSREITSGVYIATIQASGFNKSIKLLLTK